MNNRNAKDLMILYGLSDDDLKQIASFKPVIEKNINVMSKSFYDWLETTPEYEEFFDDPEILKHAKSQQIKYWLTFFTGVVDDEYLSYRKKIGEIHARIGLPLEIYLAGVEHFSEFIIGLLDRSKMTKAKLASTKRACLKLIHIDMNTIVQTYEEMVNHKIASQSKALLEMSTPVTQLWSGLLLLPVVGLIDSKRAQDIMNNSLNKISETHAQSFILDISGVAVVDTAVANHLIKITKATKLMGCECIISGVSPAIAQTIVELGIDIGTIKTTPDMKAALESSFNQMGMEIINAS
jgi:rsbT co-antagonist protein RsbR